MTRFFSVVLICLGFGVTANFRVRYITFVAFETVPITVQYNGYSTRLLLSCLLFICIIVQIYNCIFITLLIWPIAFRHNSSPMFTFSACVSAFFVSGLKFSRFSPPLISLPALVSLMIMIGYNIGIACTKFHGCGCILTHWKRAGLSRACDNSSWSIRAHDGKLTEIKNMVSYWIWCESCHFWLTAKKA